MNEHDGQVDEARAAAEAWLAWVDRGDAHEAWRRASELFRRMVSEEKWRESLERAQLPVGRAVSRTFRSGTYTTELPGAPDGEYVVLEYATTFERKRNGVETVTMQREADGEWRLSGCYRRLKISHLGRTKMSHPAPRSSPGA